MTKDVPSTTVLSPDTIGDLPSLKWYISYHMGEANLYNIAKLSVA